MFYVHNPFAVRKEGSISRRKGTENRDGLLSDNVEKRAKKSGMSSEKPSKNFEEERVFR